MSSRLYVGNLSFNSTSESVREAFAQHGTVTDVHLVLDRQTGQSRGFAFVTMGDDAQAVKATAAMNGAMLMVGRFASTRPRIARSAAAVVAVAVAAASVAVVVVVTAVVAAAIVAAVADRGGEIAAGPARCRRCVGRECPCASAQGQSAHGRRLARDAS